MTRIITSSLALMIAVTIMSTSAHAQCATCGNQGVHGTHKARGINRTKEEVHYPRLNRYQNLEQPYYAWHANYAYTQYAQPLALVVPPTADVSRHYSWGVGQTTLYPIHHQYGRSPHAGAYHQGGFAPTPRWPSHTDQMGVYYIRGPW